MSVLVDDSADPSGAAGNATLAGGPLPLSRSGESTRKGRPPRGTAPAELVSTLAKLLGGGTVLLAAWLQVEEAAMTPDEAHAISAPLARLLARQKWAKALTKNLSEWSDGFDLVVALGAYGLRVYPLIAIKLEAQARVNSARPASPVWQPSAPPTGGAASASAAGVEIPGGNGVRFTGDAGFFADDAA